MEELNYIYMIDSKMFGFEKYSSIYLIKGGKNALIDTGLPTQLNTVRAGIKRHGLSMKDISYIFVTHCEHPDHSGNVGSLVKENPNVEVYIHPKGLEYLTNPEIEAAQRKKILPPEMASRFGEMLPVPLSNIKLLSDGEVFNISNKVELEVIFAPGHQPSGIVLFEKNSKGLFIND
ncbi:MAG: MBL fold metallo-hydrolase, partial [Candidatus Bathyarchaeia archaeon]